MQQIEKLTKKIKRGGELTWDEGTWLLGADLMALTQAGNEIRQHFCGNHFHLCGIFSVKSGKCTEDCKYCAQSMHHKTDCVSYPLVDEEMIAKEVEKQWDQGLHRLSLVASGRSISKQEVEQVCDSVQNITSKTPMPMCGSFGLLTETEYRKLYQSGIRRIHNNLETSPTYFKKMCTTHTFEDKVASIKQAQKSGMEICSGGIFGIGESALDRISLAFELKKLGVKSIPLNLLNPIKGTPYAENTPLTSDELCRIVAIFRFILPDAFVRLAGGRGVLPDKGRACFSAGANATITGDLLTTSGISIESDKKMLTELGFQITRND